MIMFLSDLRELDRDARPRDQHRAGRMVNNALRATRSEHNQLRRHLVCDAQDDLRRGALHYQLTRRDKAARSQNGVRPRKYALTLDAAFKSLRFARPLEIRVPLFIRPRTRVQEKKLGVARRHFRRNADSACIAVRPAERNEDAKRFSRRSIAPAAVGATNRLRVRHSLSSPSYPGSVFDGRRQCCELPWAVVAQAVNEKGRR